eukprot:TRINITY_DN56_c0_g1_i12.p1 TRINITY_DN56_c0_g1~~TRINITY_DN56_c0_g1_i12.p1  ORF type:complete len:372 (-),score=85.31 TRINITY_DN56_c0_g1_i12:139-1254(-)
MIQNTVQKFAREMIGPKVAQMDREGKMCPELIKQCFEHGLMGIEISPEFGGAGMKFMASIITIEELARVDPSVSVCVDVQNTIVGIPLRKWGSKEQQEKWFPRLSTDTVGSFCLSEWSSGSDAFALKTTARREGKNFVLNGTKAWITNSAEAGCFIVMANVDHSLGYKGITAFIVDGTNPGIRVGKREDKLGIRASSTCEVVLTDCVVSEEDVLGEIGKGYKYAIEALNEGRIGIAAQMLGLAQGALDATMPYINQRQQFGKPISSFQGVMFDYAHAATDIEAARLLVYNAARLLEEGKPFVKEAAMAKLFASNVAAQVSSKCVELLGGVGFTKEFPVEKFYRDSKIGQIYEGTSNIQLQTIAGFVKKQYE